MPNATQETKGAKKYTVGLKRAKSNRMMKDKKLFKSQKSVMRHKSNKHCMNKR